MNIKKYEWILVALVSPFHFMFSKASPSVPCRHYIELSGVKLHLKQIKLIYVQLFMY